MRPWRDCFTLMVNDLYLRVQDELMHYLTFPKGKYPCTALHTPIYYSEQLIRSIYHF